MIANLRIDERSHVTHLHFSVHADFAASVQHLETEMLVFCHPHVIASSVDTHFELEECRHLPFYAFVMGEIFLFIPCGEEKFFDECHVNHG